MEAFVVSNELAAKIQEAAKGMSKEEMSKLIGQLAYLGQDEIEKRIEDFKQG